MFAIDICACRYDYPSMENISDIGIAVSEVDPFW